MLIEMYGFYVIFSIIAALNGQIINQLGCGLRPVNVDVKRITGGVEAIPQDFGWQVAISYNNRHICGGALINANWILSAAHCLEFGISYPNRYVIGLGLHDRFSTLKGSEARRVSLIVAHPLFNRLAQQNDVALFKLDTPVTINNQTIIPACLNTNMLKLDKMNALATGWGSKSLGTPLVRRKFEVTLPILNDTECKAAFLTVNPSVQLCAGRFGLGKDTCQGDSGGPLVVESNKKWYQVGITSFGAKKCGDGGVYVRVSSYIDWITKTIAAN